MGSADDVVLEITLTMPKEIDMANSTLVSGRTVRWPITYSHLTEDLRLRAMTH